MKRMVVTFAMLILLFVGYLACCHDQYEDELNPPGTKNAWMGNKMRNRHE